MMAITIPQLSRRNKRAQHPHHLQRHAFSPSLLVPRPCTVSSIFSGSAPITSCGSPGLSRRQAGGGGCTFTTGTTTSTAVTTASISALICKAGSCTALSVELPPEYGASYNHERSRRSNPKSCEFAEPSIQEKSQKNHKS